MRRFERSLMDGSLRTRAQAIDFIDFRSAGTAELLRACARKASRQLRDEGKLGKEIEAGESHDSSMEFDAIQSFCSKQGRYELIKYARRSQAARREICSNCSRTARNT